MVVGKVTFCSNEFFCCFLVGVFSCEVQGVKMKVNKENIRYILQFFYDKGKNASQTAKIVDGVCGSEIVTANYVQFQFRRFRSEIFYVNYSLRTGRPVDIIRKIIKVYQHVLKNKIVFNLLFIHYLLMNMFFPKRLWNYISILWKQKSAMKLMLISDSNHLLPKT